MPTFIFQKWAFAHFYVKKSIDRSVHGQIKSGQRQKSGQTEIVGIKEVQDFYAHILENPIIIKKIKKIDRYVHKLKF